jgi:hypothetical protein
MKFSIGSAMLLLVSCDAFSRQSMLRYVRKKREKKLVREEKMQKQPYPSAMSASYLPA